MNRTHKAKQKFFSFKLLGLRSIIVKTFESLWKKKLVCFSKNSFFSVVVCALSNWFHENDDVIESLIINMRWQSYIDNYGIKDLTKRSKSLFVSCIINRDAPKI